MRATCTICSESYAHAYHCQQAHPDVCHGCAQANAAGAYAWYDHATPPPAPALALGPRDVAALVQYRQHALRTTLAQEDT